MEELFNKVNNIINTLDNLDCVTDIKKMNKEILSDKELVNLLNDYQIKNDDSTKNKILSNPLFQKYKEKEIDINILIMRINQKIKLINNRRSCKK